MLLFYKTVTISSSSSSFSSSVSSSIFRGGCVDGSSSFFSSSFWRRSWVKQKNWNISKKIDILSSYFSDLSDLNDDVAEGTEAQDWHDSVQFHARAQRCAVSVSDDESERLPKPVVGEGGFLISSEKCAVKAVDLSLPHRITLKIISQLNLSKKKIFKNLTNSPEPRNQEENQGTVGVRPPE